MSAASTALVAVLAALIGTATVASASTVGDFSYGQLQDTTPGGTGCGTNAASEPAIRISDAGNVFLGSELGLGQGSELWRGLGATGGSGASACGLEFRGQPNASAGAGAGGGDIDLAIAPSRSGGSAFTLYVASLNGGSVSVAHSTDDGSTFSNVPVQAGIPADDRPWIAAYDSASSLLTFADQTTGDINVLRSTNGGQTYTQVSQAIPLLTDYRSGSNQLGNLAIDHTSGIVYQSYVAPSTSAGQHPNEYFVAMSSDHGASWTQNAIPCSTASAGTGLDHSFPNITVDQSSGRVWAAWSDDTSVYTASSDDRGATWACSGAVSTTTVRGIFPWIAARNGGADLVFYGTPARTNPTWYVEFAQNPSGQVHGWQAPQQLMPVHTGDVCEQGANCTSQRQLFEDFGVDIDAGGYAHIAYSHDAPDLGGAGSYTGYAVQVAGERVGAGPTPAPGASPSPSPGAGPTGISLPSGCTHGGPFVIGVRRPPGSRIRSVTVLVNGHRVAHRNQRHGSRLRIELSGLPSGTSRVRVVVKLSHGRRHRKLTTTRTYHSCPAGTTRSG